jgi:hypothetical protein
MDSAFIAARAFASADTSIATTLDRRAASGPEEAAVRSESIRAWPADRASWHPGAGAGWTCRGAADRTAWALPAWGRVRVSE